MIMVSPADFLLYSLGLSSVICSSSLFVFALKSIRFKANHEQQLPSSQVRPENKDGIDLNERLLAFQDTRFSPTPVLRRPIPRVLEAPSARSIPPRRIAPSRAMPQAVPNKTDQDANKKEQ